MPGSTAYGLTFEGLPSLAARLCSTADRPTPVVTVEILGGTDYGARDDVFIDDEHASLRLAEGWLEVVRRPNFAIRYHVEQPLTHEMLIHPYLAFPAAVVNHWLGRVVLHAGAFVVDDVAIAVLGTKEAGKSSTLARAASEGYEVLCDDLLVLDGTEAMVGPRAVDLRGDAAAVMGGRYLGVVGARERWRISLPDTCRTTRLGGIVVLGWGSHTRTRLLPAHGRVAPLLDSAALGSGWMAPDAAFELMAVPMWEVVRVRELEALTDVVDAIQSLARSRAGVATRVRARR